MPRASIATPQGGNPDMSAAARGKPDLRRFCRENHAHRTMRSGRFRPRCAPIEDKNDQRWMRSSRYRVRGRKYTDPRHPSWAYSAKVSLCRCGSPQQSLFRRSVSSLTLRRRNRTNSGVWLMQSLQASSARTKYTQRSHISVAQVPQARNSQSPRLSRGTRRQMPQRCVGASDASAMIVLRYKDSCFIFTDRSRKLCLRMLNGRQQQGMRCCESRRRPLLWRLIYGTP